MDSEMNEIVLGQIEQYLKGELTGEELRSFEEQLAANENLKEEVALQRQLVGVFSDDDWISIDTEERNEEIRKRSKLLKGEELQGLSATIRAIGKEHVQEQSNKRYNSRYFYYVAAAAVIAIICVFWSTYQNSLDSYYGNYVSWNELPSYTEKGTVSSNFEQGVTAFKQKEYPKALALFEGVTREHELYPLNLIYLGATYELMGKNEEAIQRFEELTALNTFAEHSKGYWYQLLIYLKTNQEEKAKEIIKVILSDKSNYRYNDALQLKEELGW